MKSTYFATSKWRLTTSKVLFLSIILVLLSFTKERKFEKPGAPGVIPAIGDVQIDETEMANIHWLEYLYYLRIDSSEQAYQEALPDTNVWTQCEFWYQAKLFTDHYLRYPGFRYYPVVGVSHAQVQKYAVWRSHMVFQKYNADIHKDTNQLNWASDSLWFFNYRLPTEKEWEAAATGPLDPAKFPHGLEDIYTKYKMKDWENLYALSDSSLSAKTFKKKFHSYSDRNWKFAINCKQRSPPEKPDFIPCETFELKSKHRLFKSTPPTTNIYYSPPNYAAFYEMMGNVAEMVAEPNIAKGGSFKDSLSECTVKGRQQYSSPQHWLGVRFACEIYKIKNPYKK